MPRLYRYLIWTSVLLLIGGIGGGALSWVTSSNYRATTGLYFVSASKNSVDAYQATLVGQQRMTTYAALIQDPQVISTALAEAKVSGVTASELRDGLSVANPPGSIILNVSVDNKNAGVAARLANSVANVVIVLISRLETPIGTGDAPVGLTVIRPASQPTEYRATVQPLYVAGGAVVGGLLVGLFAGIVWIRGAWAARRASRPPKAPKQPKQPKAPKQPKQVKPTKTPRKASRPPQRSRAGRKANAARRKNTP